MWCPASQHRGVKARVLSVEPAKENRSERATVRLVASDETLVVSSRQLADSDSRAALEALEDAKGGERALAGGRPRGQGEGHGEGGGRERRDAGGDAGTRDRKPKASSGRSGWSFV